MPVLYLLDANAFIDANRDYYPIDRVPEFWNWLVFMGEQGLVKVPLEIFEEVVNPPPARRDEVSEWLNGHEDSLLLDEAASVALVARVTDIGYASDLTDVEVSKIGRDPFLIAYALVDNRVVVSNEISKPSRQRANRKVPDVCNDANLGVRCINMFRLIRELDFRTDWRTDA